jgi:hypothetical protein
MADSAIDIEQKLKQAWRQERRFYNIRGMSRFLVWLTVMIVLDFVIDWAIMFKTRMTFNMALLLLAINIAVLAWVLWHEWMRYLKPFNPLMVALEVEGRHPELSSVLVSYTQLHGLTANQPNVSAELIDAMRDQAVVQTRPLDFREIVDFGQLKQLFLVAAGVLLIFAGISYQWPQEVRIMFQRLAGLDEKYPTETTVTLEVDSEIIVQVGDSVNIKARANGVTPSTGELYKKSADSDAEWSIVPMEKAEHGPTYERQLKNLTTDQEFYVRINDFQTEKRRIRVIQKPRILETHVNLTYPEYMNRSGQESEQLTLEVREGAYIKWQFECEPAVERVLVKSDRSVANQDIIAAAIREVTSKPETPLTDKAQQQLIEDVVKRLMVEADGPLDENETVNFIESKKELITERAKRLISRTGGSLDGEAKEKIIEEEFKRLFDETDADIEGGKEVTFAMRAKDSFKYTFRWTERDSGKSFVFDDVQHGIRVVPDSVPEIELVRPSSGGMATVDKKLMLSARAKDDHGLSKAWLVYSVDGSEEKSVEIFDFKGGLAKEFSHPWTLSDSVEDLKPAMQITFAVVVGDLHPDAELRKRRSVTRHLSIVEPERYLQWYRAELAAQAEAIKRAQSAERVSSTKVKQIKVQEGVDE